MERFKICLYKVVFWENSKEEVSFYFPSVTISLAPLLPIPAVSRAVNGSSVTDANAHCFFFFQKLLFLSEVFVHQPETSKALHSKHPIRISNYYQVSFLCNWR